jgi:L-alanine-DL-glutamate epimerase-like enolase superfamily enzyme
VPLLPKPQRVAGARLTGEIWKVFTRFERPLSIASANHKGGLTQKNVDGFSNMLALLRDEKGGVGVGYSGYLSDIEAVCRAAVALLCTSNITLGQLLNAQGLVSELAPAEPIRARNDAAAALSLAAWDLLGRMVGVSCADLWGRDPGRQSLECYYSGFWLDCSLTELIEEARLRRSQGYRAVKMRASFSVETDVARVEAVATVFSEPGTIALEALNSWTPERVQRFVIDSPVRLMWLEDSLPLSPDLPHAYRALSDIAGRAVELAAGESCCTHEELCELVDVGKLTRLLPDIGALGGPMQFLRAAHSLEQRGASISSHLFPQYSSHLLAALGRPLPLEMADWWDVLFLDRCQPDPDGRVRIEGPGFGMRLDQEALRKCGERVLEFEI